jgi:hypothetical protein
MPVEFKKKQWQSGNSGHPFWKHFANEFSYWCDFNNNKNTFINKEPKFEKNGASCDVISKLV